MSMGLSMRMRVYQVQEPRLVQELVEVIGESLGDIPLLSLHRIKNRIDKPKTGMQVHSKVRSNLLYNLLKANQEYRAETKRNWNCITGNSLDCAVDKTNEYLINIADTGLVSTDSSNKEIIKKVLYKKVEEQTSVIKKWFYTNYDNLIYNMEGKIPWLIVRRMRDELGKWSLENVNPFNLPIGELIKETISSIGLKPDDYKSSIDMWKELKKHQ